ncbi:hypothetical protein [Streptomyces sp. LN785]|uniref:hypothetical protein n=1 Tax=Streptomyces sp. LN785 TaxID=3112983 RepID=UPI00371A5A36
MQRSTGPRDALKPRSQVPVWRKGLAPSALAVDYQRVLAVLADRSWLRKASTPAGTTSIPNTAAISWQVRGP